MPRSIESIEPGSLMSHRISAGFALWLVGMTVVAGGFRLYHLDAASFWVDELNTVRVCADLEGTHRSKVFGYIPTTIGLWLNGVDVAELGTAASETWRDKGVTEWSSRIASAVIGIACIPILGLASCPVLGRRAAGWFALFLAVAPWHVYWSQASRFYTQQFLFYTLALLWYYRATQERSRPRFVAAMVAMVLAYLSQPPAIIVCGVFAVDWLLGLVRRRPVRLYGFGWSAAMVALGTCAAVLAYDVWHDPQDWEKFSGALYQTPATMLLGAVYMIGPAVVLFAALTGWRMTKEHDRLGWYLVLVAVIPPAFYAVTSLWSYVGLRYTFICFYGWLALAALGTEWMYGQLRRASGPLLAATPAGLLLVAMLLMNYGYFTSGDGFHTRWRDAFAYVAARRQPGELVFSDTQPIIGRYYLQDASVERIPASAEALRALERPAWIVVETEDAIRGEVKSWIEQAAELKAYFDVRVLQPYSSVRVYKSGID